MKKKIIGILICTLLSANISNVMIVISQTQIHDVGVESIDSPRGTVSPIPYYTQPVIVTIKNYGGYPERNFFTRVVIGNFYTEYAAVVSWMQPDETRTLVFPEVTFPSEGIYSVTACTLLDIDTNPSNNCSTITVTVSLGPDLIIHDRSTGTFTPVGDNIYEPPIWPSVTQIGKWTRHRHFPNWDSYICRIQLQNDGIVPLVGYTINAMYFSGSGKFRLFYRDTSNSFSGLFIPGSTTSGIQINPTTSKYLFIVGRTLSSGVQIGVNVISTSGAEDSIIFAP